MNNENFFEVINSLSYTNLEDVVLQLVNLNEIDNGFELYKTYHTSGQGLFLVIKKKFDILNRNEK